MTNFCKLKKQQQNTYAHVGFFLQAREGVRCVSCLICMSFISFNYAYDIQGQRTT